MAILDADPAALDRPLGDYGGTPEEAAVTPLAWAMERDKPEMVALLQARGARPPTIDEGSDLRLDLSCGNLSILDMSIRKAEVPYGTLDILILKTLDTMGPLHGYSLARRIEQVSEDLLRLSQGSVYPALIRLEQQGWIRTEWGVSDTNRKVKVYALTETGAEQLRVAVANWERATALVARFLEAKA